MMLPILLLALSAPAQGQWLKLFDEADESTYLDVSTLRRGPEAMVWIRHDFPRPRTGGVKSIRNQWHVSCRERSFTIYAIVSYDRAGRVLKASAVPTSERHAAPLVAGSRMEKVFSAVCERRS